MTGTLQGLFDLTNRVAIVIDLKVTGLAAEDGARPSQASTLTDK